MGVAWFAWFLRWRDGRCCWQDVVLAGVTADAISSGVRKRREGTLPCGSLSSHPQHSDSSKLSMSLCPARGVYGHRRVLEFEAPLAVTLNQPGWSTSGVCTL